MGRCVIKLGNKYCEWSSVSDSPYTPLLSEEHFRMYWKDEYGRSREYELPEIFFLCNKCGTSSRFGKNNTAESVIKGNRAGVKEKTLSKKELIDSYSIDSLDEFKEWSKKKDEYTKEDVKQWEKITAERFADKP